MSDLHDLSALNASLDALSPLVDAVTAAATERAAANAAKREASIALLTNVLDRVSPSLPALASRVQIGRRTFWPTNVDIETEETFADWRGLLVQGDGKPERDYPRANAGRYEGSSLYLSSSGEFVQVDYEGYWSKWQGTTSEWTSKVSGQTLAEVVDGDWSLASIIDAIAAKLKAVAEGNLLKRAEQTRERAAKLQALATLMRR